MRYYFFLFFIIASFFVSAQETGELDCSDCKSKRDTAFNNTLILKSAENTFSVVRLVHIEKNECVRKIFLKPGESFTVENIPFGNYHVKFVIGSEWNYNKKNSCKLNFKGAAPFFMRIDKPLSFKKIRKGDSYELSEYTVKMGLGFSPTNAANKKISKGDFNN
ncbi:MAG: hypothetical protein A2275_07795 [Bacteroidetes bacterium RIFOXYA12_FULL_35_11]|nr:MAG: hypothetical protein A2X01_18290 [Bacteroidetes bacterium GWF2_35_48]OFY76428.1 MAG: hypothetical protein A2275_07795 [Bacteroidetes bacterium RIFOXYA12_FULL_35_11]OFY94429.1 MAG: hypothetical protein A2309_03175 [Bacteroidetes bacterium RIFOXYB2_FULL_35_7]OFZ00677.1 MAG: hypothetical protein A2491_14975 [Bacteroidetes bacterium RIFOXYC12_FULL_35_7]HBX52423.1 hypothetical protein [Bacteroidales bacterium]